MPPAYQVGTRRISGYCFEPLVGGPLARNRKGKTTVPGVAIYAASKKLTAPSYGRIRQAP